MVGLKRGIGRKQIHDVEASLWSERHRHRDRAIQLNDWTRRKFRQRIVQRRDTRPISLCRGASAGVARSDGGLHRVRTSRPVESFGLLKFGEPMADQGAIPARAVFTGSGGVALVEN